MIFLHTLLNIFLIITSLLVIFSRNPVYSVLFLILTFLTASFISILFNAEFLGILFIIIYVGAIAVLFLFVIMMLNIKVLSIVNYFFAPIFLLIGIILFFQLFLNLLNIFSSKDVLEQASFLQSFDGLENINIFGQVLYNYFLIGFLIAGIILLVAMIGAIVLTLNFKNKKKHEINFRQLSRSDKFISFFHKIT